MFLRSNSVRSRRFLLFFVPFLLVGCTASQAGEFQSPTYRIAFYAPRGYAKRLDAASAGDTLVRYRKKELDEFPPQFSVVAVKLPPTAPQNAVAPDAESRYRAAMGKETEFQHLGTAKFKVKGADARSFGYTYKDTGTTETIRGRQVVFVRKGISYTFTFAAPQEVFTAETPRFEKVISTVRWLE